MIVLQEAVSQDPVARTVLEFVALELENAFLRAYVLYVGFLWERVLFVSHLDDYRREVVLIIVGVAEALVQALRVKVAKHLFREETSELLKFPVGYDYICIAGVDNRHARSRFNRPVADLDLV